MAFCAVFGRLVSRYYFDLHDVDGSGEIDAEEMPFVLRCLGVPLTIARLRFLWSVNDSNGNGSIGCGEFVNWFAQDGWTWRTFPHKRKRRRHQPLSQQREPLPQAEVPSQEQLQSQPPQSPLQEQGQAQESKEEPKQEPQELQVHQDSDRHSEEYDFYGNKIKINNTIRKPSDWVGKSVLYGPSALAYRSLQWRLAKGGRAAVDAELRLRAKARYILIEGKHALFNPLRFL